MIVLSAGVVVPAAESSVISAVAITVSDAMDSEGETASGVDELGSVAEPLSRAGGFASVVGLSSTGTGSVSGVVIDGSGGDRPRQRVRCPGQVGSSRLSGCLGPR